MDTGEKIIALLRQQLTASEFDEFTQILDDERFLDRVDAVNAEINPQSYADPAGFAPDLSC